MGPWGEVKKCSKQTDQSYRSRRRGRGGDEEEGGGRGGGVGTNKGTFGTNRMGLSLERTDCPSTMALRKPATSFPASSLSLSLFPPCSVSSLAGEGR